MSESDNLLAQQTAANEYGSNTTGTDEASEEEEEEEEEDDEMGRASFHLARSTGVTKANVWTSMRFTESFIEYGDDYDKVPTMLKENMALLLDSNLHPNDRGHLYYAESTFYNVKEEPHYALTVNCDIYQRMIQEVSDSKSVPCGLYYCCHDAGDLEHQDHVDIRFAWMLLTTLFLAMLAVSTV